ncbi:MAG: cyclic nucleotide-binding domain-containing protein, partial [Bacteroidota bacterium]
RQFFPGDMIVWQGQPSTTLFMIVSGIVAVKNMAMDKERVLAYLMPGNIFGEVGILENQPRSASVEALSEVDVLAIKREDFIEILAQHSSVAVELARMLGRYLIQANRRLSTEGSETKMILIFNTENQSGGTSIGTLLSRQLATDYQHTTAYFEYPNPWRMLEGHQLRRGTTTYHHSDGYDILFPQDDGFLPLSTRTMLLLDKVKGHYDNLVIKIQGDGDETTGMLLEQAKQVMIITTPTELGIKRLEKIHKQIRNRIRPEDTSIFTVVNRYRPEYAELQIDEIADFEVPYLTNFPPFSLDPHDPEAIPQPLKRLVDASIDRLERTNSVGIYIPTTVDGNKPIDTSVYVEEAKSFMGQRFGGATGRVASGVWYSEKLGIIDEVVYHIHSYTTQEQLNLHLDEVIGYIKKLKRTLNQEAMALEVNNKLTLL